MAHESTLALMSRGQLPLGQAKPLPDLQTAWASRPPQEKIQSNVLLRPLLMAMSGQGLNISKNGVSTTFLGNLD